MTYYKENLPNLIQRLKNSISKIETIIDGDIEEGITDDKLFNVLKAKRQASEDVVWTLKKIDELENELKGVDSQPEEKVTVVKTQPKGTPKKLKNKNVLSRRKSHKFNRRQKPFGQKQGKVLEVWL
jgi:hypothetical protein